MLFLDFWGDNPFADLDLPFPPVPSEQQVRLKVNERKTERMNRLRRLQGHKLKEGSKAKEETEQLEKELHDLKVRQREIAVKVRELAVALPFDTLLAVQAIAPHLFFEKSARVAVIAQAWCDLVGEDAVTLSDTRRLNFEKDFTRNPLLDDSKDDEAENWKGEDYDA